VAVYRGPAGGAPTTEGKSIKSLWIARDGDLYSLPADGDEVERSNLIGRGPGA
jgi:hypothetical protein